MAKLKRTLRLGEVVFFACGVILGAGIYTVIGEGAGFGGNMLWLSILVAAVTAGMTAFSYAELCAMYPEAGGEYAYAKRAFENPLQVTVGLMVSLSGILGAATISIGFAGYFSELLNFNLRLGALCIILLILFINITGIRQSSATNIVFTIIETAGLGYVIYSAWPAVGDIDYFELPPAGAAGVMAGAALCFFAFTGFEDTVKLAEETKNPERNIPRALFMASTIVAVIYVLVVIAAVSAVPYGQLAESDSPLSAIVESRFGRTGALIIAVVALFSTSNSLLSNMMGASRVLYTIAGDTRRLKWLAFISPKRQTPVTALVLAAACAAAFSLIGDIKTVALIANFFVLGTFLLVNLAAIRLRITKKNEKRPFRIPGTIGAIPVIPVLAIIMTLVLGGFAVYGLLSGNTVE